MLNNILNILIVPFILLAVIVCESIRKKRPSDAFNSKISTNLKEYEKEVNSDIGR